MNIFKKLLRPKIKVSTVFEGRYFWTKVNGKWEYLYGITGLENKKVTVLQTKRGKK